MELAERLKLQHEGASARAALAKSAMRGGGAIKLVHPQSNPNIAAAAIHDIATPGVVTLYTAAGAVRRLK